MPVDALFESMPTGTGVWRPVSSIRRRMALAMPANPQDAGIPAQYSREGNEQISTTESTQFVVENRPEKSALKVLVEAFLLAFCPTCRRADIFHRLAVLGSGGRGIPHVPSQESSPFLAAMPSTRVSGRPQKAVPTFGLEVASQARVSSPECRDRRLRRSATDWTRSIFSTSTNFFFRSEGTLPSRQDSSRSFTQSKSKRGIS
jgi:hypothetical protein